MGKQYLNGVVYGGIIDFAKNVGQSVGIRDVTNLITPHSGITLASDFVYKAIQIGDIVFLSADGGIASGASSNDYVLFDIDSSILPVTRAFIWGYGGNASIKYFRAFPDGTVHAQDGWCNFELYWQVAQTYYGNSVHNYSTTEQIVGTWIDGKPIYEKSYVLDTPLLINHSNWTATTFPATSIKMFLRADGQQNGSATAPIIAAVVNGYINILFNRYNSSETYLTMFTVQYTKTTD